MKNVCLCLVLTLGFGTAFAGTYHCKQGKISRKVEVQHPETAAVPCKVVYTKDGVDAVLWNADHEADYCKTKADEFLVKMKGDGWQCDEAVKAEAAAAVPATAPEHQAPAQEPVAAPATTPAQ